MSTDTLLTIKTGNLINEKKFFLFCQMNDTLRIERDSQRNIILLPPTGIKTSSENLKIVFPITKWNLKNELGEAFSSTSVFTLPNGAVRASAFSWIAKFRWEKLSKEEQESFAPICPDFVLEIRTSIDDLKYLLNKMEEYISNGAQLAWLIDRVDKKVYIYHSGKPVEIYNNLDVKLSGEAVLPGFTMDLGAIVNKFL
jgi:Uma2 family endonuclease